MLKSEQKGNLVYQMTFDDNLWALKTKQCWDYCSTCHSFLFYDLGLLLLSSFCFLDFKLTPTGEEYQLQFPRCCVAPVALQLLKISFVYNGDNEVRLSDSPE